VAAFAHEVEVELAEQEGEGVGVELFVSGAGGELVLKAIACGWGTILLSFGERCFKETFGTELGCFDYVLRIGETNGGGNCAGMEGANDPAAARGRFDVVRAEDRERIGVAADDERVNGLIERRFLGGGRLCDGFFGALFRQRCVSPTCREASLDHYAE
jgi:hypothetical protein